MLRNAAAYQVSATLLQEVTGSWPLRSQSLRSLLHSDMETALLAHRSGLGTLLVTAMTRAVRGMLAGPAKPAPGQADGSAMPAEDVNSDLWPKLEEVMELPGTVASLVPGDDHFNDQQPKYIDPTSHQVRGVGWAEHPARHGCSCVSQIALGSSTLPSPAQHIVLHCHSQTIHLCYSVPRLPSLAPRPNQPTHPLLHHGLVVCVQVLNFLAGTIHRMANFPDLVQALLTVAVLECFSLLLDQLASSCAPAHGIGQGLGQTLPFTPHHAPRMLLLHHGAAACARRLLLAFRGPLQLPLFDDYYEAMVKGYANTLLQVGSQRLRITPQAIHCCAGLLSIPPLHFAYALPADQPCSRPCHVPGSLLRRLRSWSRRCRSRSCACTASPPTRLCSPPSTVSSGTVSGVR